MFFFLTLFLFLILAAVFCLLGTTWWVKPKAAIDRVTGAVYEQEHITPHPSLAFHELVKKLGNLVPAAPKDTSVMERRLMKAGFRRPGSLKILYGSKVLLAVLLPSAAGVIVARSHADSSNALIAILASGAMGFFGPNEYVRMRTKGRQKQIRRGLPNALDLMVVCVESGLGLDQAVVQVAKELQFAHPEISEEFALMNFELKAGKKRTDALRNLADRAGVDEVKKLVAVLIQADRFGTSVSQTLRGHSEYMRVQTRQQVEERAAKLGVKLVFPIFFCILPSLFVVTVGPVIVRIMKDLLPMMNNM